MTTTRHPIAHGVAVVVAPDGVTIDVCGSMSVDEVALYALYAQPGSAWQATLREAVRVARAAEGGLVGDGATQFVDAPL